MIPLSKNIRTIPASRLEKIADRFSLSPQQKRLQAKIIDKLFAGAIETEDLPRVIFLNLNLSKKQAATLARVLEKEVNADLGHTKTEEKTPAAPARSPKPIVARLPKKPGRQGALELAAWLDHLIVKLNLNLSALQKSRLESSVLTYLKDIRDTIETEEVLTRLEKRGGVGLPSAQAIKIVEDFKESFPEEGRVGIKDYKIYSRQDYEWREIKEEIPGQGAAPAAPIPPVAPVRMPIISRETRVVSDVRKPREPIPIAPVAPAKAEEEGLNISAINTVEDLSKVNIQGFKGVNPEELAKQFIAKIKSLIGKNDLERFKAVEAWRASPVYKLYLEMGEESIASGQTVAEIGGSRFSQKKPYLSPEEFNAVADISRELQY